MLVLTRKTGQRIMIGDEIEVAVLSSSGDKVRLGITASKEVPIYREEVYRRIEDEDENGASPESVDHALRGMSEDSAE
jgi:carbon storage regulator